MWFIFSQSSLPLALLIALLRKSQMMLNEMMIFRHQGEFCLPAVMAESYE